MQQPYTAKRSFPFSSKPDDFNRLALALFISVAIHLFVIYGLQFKFPDLSKLEHLSAPMEVVLVNSKSRTKPVHADALAQANLDGGGNTDLDRRATRPLPVMQRDQPDPDVEQATARVRKLEQQSQQLLTQLKSKQRAEQSTSQTQQTEQAAEEINGLDLVQKSLQMARLEAQIDKQTEAYQKRPKRLSFGGRAQEFYAAQYMDDWRIKVERIGNENYPEAAKQQKIYGNLRLAVSIKADGSIEKIEISRSSGHKVLDDAAILIVKRAAPYPVFQDELRKKADILEIIRTWTFTRDDEIVTK